jgi:hypothetical protein
VEVGVKEVNAGQVSLFVNSLSRETSVFSNKVVFLLSDRDRFYDGCMYIYMVLADHHYHLPQ